MSGETQLWRYLKNGMRGRWDAQRHEDKFSTGVPDVSYALEGVDGWIELKSLSKWPARESTPVRIGLRKEQSIWLAQRAQSGNGRCFILVRVGREHLLFHAVLGGPLVRGIIRSEMYALATNRWTRGIDWDTLCHELTKEMKDD